jgi:myosin heavy subunit
MLVDDATKAKEDAISERNEARQQLQDLQTQLQDLQTQLQDLQTQLQDLQTQLQDLQTQLQDLRTRSANDLDQKKIEFSTLEDELRANQESAVELQEELSSYKDEAREQKRKLEAQDSSTTSSRRTAREALLSSPEPGLRSPTKRRTLTGQSGIPLPSKTGSINNPTSLDSPATDRRTSTSTRTSGGRTSFGRVGAQESQPERVKRTPFDIEASYSMLVLPAEWDDNKRATFKQQYSAIKNNEPSAQVDLLNKSSIRTCLIATFEKQKSKRPGDMPIDNKGQCPSCMPKSKPAKGRICVYLENISDPDEDTQQFQVHERPEK